MVFTNLWLTSGLLCLVHTATATQLACTTDSIPAPEYFGTKVTNVAAKEVHGYDEFIFFADIQNVPYERKPIDFCNVTVTYTHPGWNDEVNVYVWLPLKGWNGRFFGQGGGGYATGAEGLLVPPVANGYAAANTDGGHPMFGEEFGTSKPWSLTSPGNINWPAFQDFASVALDDMTNLAKAVTTSFYGKAPKYSYWNGCSTGGRQGLMLAQRYPKDYDGILAAAPAINFATFVPAEFWGQLVMKRDNYFAPSCELEAIQKAAIEVCDELDGVKDGVVAAPGLCKFDAQSVVGQKYDCEGDTRKISKEAAKIANAAYEGPKRNGGNRSEWFGLTHEARLASGVIPSLLDTICDEKNENCKGAPFPIAEDWIKMFLAKDPEYDVWEMSEDEYLSLLHMSRQQYDSIISTNDPDLSEFRDAGGKMITWHGLADALIYPNGTSSYYDKVLALDPKAREYYKYYEAPGIDHCWGGAGAFPFTVFATLVDWVEKGKVPEQLDASTFPDENEATKHRILCPYPLVAAYVGGNPDEASSFECAKSFGSKKASLPNHSEL